MPKHLFYSPCSDDNRKKWDLTSLFFKHIQTTVLHKNIVKNAQYLGERRETVLLLIYLFFIIYFFFFS